MNTIFVKTIVFFSLFAIGCSPVYYKPNLMNTPNFREKEEVYWAGHITDRGYNGQAAYAITEHVFIQGDYMFSQKSESTKSSNSTIVQTSKIVGKFGEIGVGYFQPTGKLGTFSVCGGYGFGTVINDWTNRGGSYADIHKLFLQSTFGLRGKYFEVVASVKLANLDYSSLEQNYTTSEFISQFDALKKPAIMLEPAAAMRFGGKRIKFQMALTTALLLKSSPSFKYDEGAFGVGLCLQLNPKKDF